MVASCADSAACLSVICACRPVTMVATALLRSDTKADSRPPICSISRLSCRARAIDSVRVHGYVNPKGIVCLRGRHSDRLARGK